MRSGDDPLVLGAAALARGDWPGARAQFETALLREETARGSEGLSDALYWLDEVEASLHHRTRAYVLYLESGDFCSAMRAALWLAWGYMGSYGNAAVANGWLQRVERMLQDAGDCAEWGWYEQFRSKMAPDAATSIGHARRAMEIAGRHKDRDLEVWALSQLGRALVTMGRVDEGMALLDEAVAAATAGEARNLLVVGDTCCNMLSACDRAADFDRATQWCQVVDEFTRRHNGTPVFSYCRVVYSGVLMATGRWTEAEKELRTGLQAVQKEHPSQKVYSLCRLALLCIRQGRLEEAARLLEGCEAHGAAVEAVVSMHLACGRSALADALLERRMAAPMDDLVAVPLLKLVVETKLQLGDLAGARSAAMYLLKVGERSQRPSIQASAALAMGKVEFASGNPCGEHFQSACACFEKLRMPYDEALTRIEWARAIAGDSLEVAREFARIALSIFERLGARLYADRTALLLRELGGGTRPGRRIPGDLTRREQEILELLSRGLSNPDIGRRLFISPKTVEHHVGRILSKLGVRNRAEAVAWALRNSLPRTGTK